MDIKEYNFGDKENKQNHPWELARFRVVYDVLKNSVTKNNQFSSQNILTILDVGCGDAFFLEQFARKVENIKAYAIDIAFDDETIKSFEEKYKASPIYFYKSIDDSRLENIQADVVFLLDVIEHIEDEISFLKQLLSKPFITNETIFVITVPAFNKLFCSHDQWLGHYRRYTVSMLREHLSAAGLKNITDGYFFFSLLPSRWLQVKKEKIRKPNLKNVAGVGDWKGGKAITSLISNFLYFDYLISKYKRKLGIKLPGLSAYAICQKQS